MRKKYVQQTAHPTSLLEKRVRKRIEWPQQQHTQLCSKSHRLNKALSQVGNGVYTSRSPRTHRANRPAIGASQATQGTPQRVVVESAVHAVAPQNITWSEDTVDNEHANKRSSKSASVVTCEHSNIHNRVLHIPSQAGVWRVERRRRLRPRGGLQRRMRRREAARTTNQHHNAAATAIIITHL